jgi:hypothetical protein
MYKIQNNRQADITVRNDEGKVHVLTPGLNEEVPEWLDAVQYVEDLADAGDILVVGFTPGEGKKDDLPPAQYKLNPETGLPIQATDEKGELVFDEATGEPVYVPADAE